MGLSSAIQNLNIEVHFFYQFFMPFVSDIYVNLLQIYVFVCQILFGSLF
jgi:hypothetical protein